MTPRSIIHKQWPTPIILKGNHATLVPLIVEHCAALIEASKDGELWKLWFASVPAPENMLAEIQRRLDLQEKGVMLPFTVIDNQTQQPIGMTTYCNIEAAHKRLEIGWTWYRKNMQRTAINTECKFMLLMHAFEELQCIAVTLLAHSFNHPSQKAILRLGAKFDGIMRNYRIRANNDIADYLIYSVIDTEWAAVKRNLLWKLGK